ncbi:MAG: STAS domain-containing protein [Anaerolineales bacterium]
MEIERVEDVAILTVNERMNIFNAPVLIKAINRLLDQGAKHFILDLSSVRVLDVDGDYPLLHLLKRAQEHDGQVILICPPNNPVRLLYEMLNLDTLFDIVETREGAFSTMGIEVEVKMEMEMEMKIE